MTIGVQTHDTSENLFTKKTEKEFFKEFEDAAVAQGKVAVLLKGFDRAESNLIIDARAYKLKQASREHTIQDWANKCIRAFVPGFVIVEWNRIAVAMNELKKGTSSGDALASEMMHLMETELKEVHDIMGKKWREAHSKEESAHRAFAILFSLIMVYELEETWLLYVNAIKAQINKTFKVLGASWKKILHNDAEMLELDEASYAAVLAKLESFDEHINHTEGTDIKFHYKA